MHPAMIRAALNVAGYTQVDIAQKCGVGRSAVHHVIRGTMRSANIEAAIAEVTGLPLYQLWPDYYRPDGRPLPRRRRRSEPGKVLRVLEQSGLAAKAAANG